MNTMALAKIKKRPWYLAEGYYVEYGRNSKGRYRQRMSFTINEANRAIMWYDMLNIGSGFKKRLVKYVNGEAEVMFRQKS